MLRHDLLFENDCDTCSLFVSYWAILLPRSTFVRTYLHTSHNPWSLARVPDCSIQLGQANLSKYVCCRLEGMETKVPKGRYLECVGGRYTMLL